jgi:hypothetical protein
MFLRANPWSGYRRCTQHEWERKALEQGRLAVSSILRDWVKAQITAIESGILSFEAVFLPFMLKRRRASGRRAPIHCSSAPAGSYHQLRIRSSSSGARDDRRR